MTNPKGFDPFLPYSGTWMRSRMITSCGWYAPAAQGSGDICGSWPSTNAAHFLQRRGLQRRDSSNASAITSAIGCSKPAQPRLSSGPRRSARSSAGTDPSCRPPPRCPSFYFRIWPLSFVTLPPNAVGAIRLPPALCRSTLPGAASPRCCRW